MMSTMDERPMATLLALDQVRFAYPDGGVGLDGCSLAIRRGSRNALLGANGSGKTTVFHHANGLLRPQSGQIRYAGQDVDYSRGGLRRLRSKVGMVFQNPDRQLFSASVLEDVSFGPFNLGLDEATVRQRVAAALLAVGMSGFADKAVHQLSFGQKKRVCIAGVLAMQPELLLLDEPMAGLDPGMQDELLRILDDLSARGISIVLATHDVDFAYRWADHIHLLASGRCSASFSASDLPQQAATLRAAGQALPAVLQLHHSLVASGVLPAAPVPASIPQLLALLAETPAGEPNMNEASPAWQRSAA